MLLLPLHFLILWVLPQDQGTSGSRSGRRPSIRQTGIDVQPQGQGVLAAEATLSHREHVRTKEILSWVLVREFWRKTGALWGQRDRFK